MSPIKSKSFISDNFLLDSELAQILYHQYAKKMPVIDYHNHLSAKQIAENKPISNITDAWLNGDHYKWRAMRANGIDETYITGTSTQKEKFLKWAETVPFTLRNPLFHWTHLELKRYFDIDAILQPENANDIYSMANSVLVQKTPADLLKDMNVEILCTTDDPTDSLEYHQEIRKQNIFTKVYPAFRPDAVLLIKHNSFLNYLKKMEACVGFQIENIDDLLHALQKRVDFFDQQGCCLSDYGLQQIYAEDSNESIAEKILKKRLDGAEITTEEAQLYASYMLYKLSKMYHKKGWVQQFHLGALRNNNNRLERLLGADAGCDSIGDFSHAASMSKFFNRLEAEQSLSKTIVYNLNPSQNEVFATMMGNYSEKGIPGKMQWGSAWWFLDQKTGMEKQLEVLSNVGLLSRFVGMLTDSRSFLSFPRHEYFRRILCNVLADDIKKGLVPDDVSYVGKMIQDICYNNAKDYFDFKKI
ncbi:glucuronate isomerase [Lutimonas zeaxanthinifaciens]|uniref:glucuronate isomerase n=1 Tax=Lutimonas zeaxanthinifaciens TaxID=3060215 RepID=UPI00265CC047|nr:glucuronate isomerase [Lutimonas sp. YSD2104]WKK65893.1 glucuronate isomerase [Lutimonas sp. YSD2104]